MATILKAKWGCGLEGGALIANPIPEQHALDPEEFEICLQNALKQAEAQGIQGKQVTPFLLSALRDLSQGQTLQANIELVLSNARVGARLASAIR